MNAETIRTELEKCFGSATTPGQAFDAIMALRREGVTFKEVGEAFGGTFTASSANTSPAPHREPEGSYTDDTLLPWGKHRGTPLKNIPDDYWRWLEKQPDPIRDKRLVAWLAGRKGVPPRAPAHSMDDPQEAPLAHNNEMEGDDVPF